VVAQGLDDIVSLDPAEANELSSIQTVPSLYQRLVQPDRDNPEKSPRFWPKAGRPTRQQKP
jgi:peptide/nickel transport system substrate-binding protein